MGGGQQVNVIGVCVNQSSQILNSLYPEVFKIGLTPKVFVVGLASKSLTSRLVTNFGIGQPEFTENDTDATNKLVNFSCRYKCGYN